MDGQCGTGKAYCGDGVCSFGHCDNPLVPEEGLDELPWAMGNTTDGTCGGEKAYTRDVPFGNCCSQDGICGGEGEHCVEECQPDFGKCGITIDLPIISCPSTGSTSQTPASTEPLESSTMINGAAISAWWHMPWRP